jgi:hypothetical protein
VRLLALGSTEAMTSSSKQVRVRWTLTPCGAASSIARAALLVQFEVALTDPSDSMSTQKMATWVRRAQSRSSRSPAQVAQ